MGVHGIQYSHWFKTPENSMMHRKLSFTRCHTVILSQNQAEAASLPGLVLKDQIHLLDECLCALAKTCCRKQSVPSIRTWNISAVLVETVSLTPWCTEAYIYLYTHTADPSSYIRYHYSWVLASIVRGGCHSIEQRKPVPLLYLQKSSGSLEGPAGGSGWK